MKRTRMTNACKRNMKQIVKSYRGVRKSRRTDKARVQSIMTKIQKEMVKRGVNLFRDSEDPLNKAFMQWNSKVEFPPNGPSMRIPDDVRSLFE